MDSVLPTLLIITAEIALVLFLILSILIFKGYRVKKKEKELLKNIVNQYLDAKDERISFVKEQLIKKDFQGNADQVSVSFIKKEKHIIGQFVTLYLSRKSHKLQDYCNGIMGFVDTFVDSDNINFGGKIKDVTTLEGAMQDSLDFPDEGSDDEKYLHEISELRLKNTELNEHLFEALETITTLMIDHTGSRKGSDITKEELIGAIMDRRSRIQDEDVDVVTTGNNNKKDTFGSAIKKNEKSARENKPLKVKQEYDIDKIMESPSGIQGTDLKDGNETILLSNKDTEEDPWEEAFAEQSLEVQRLKQQAESNLPAMEESDPWESALKEQVAMEAGR